MISVRSRYILNVKDQLSPRLVFNPLRRGIFLGTALLLGVASILGISSSPESFARQPIGTFFFFLLFFVSLAMGLYSASWNFNLKEKVIIRHAGIAGIPVTSRTYQLRDLEKVQLESVRLLSESFSPRNKDPRSFFERRKLYFKLALVFSSQRIVVDDGTDGEHMLHIGSLLAQTIGVPFSSVEL